jgi:hypothetical protein
MPNLRTTLSVFAISASLLLLSGCARKVTRPLSSIDISTPTVSIEDTSSGSYPDHLLGCPETFLSKDKNGKYTSDCSKLPKGDYCSFSKRIDDGSNFISGNAFNSECLICQIRNQKDSKFDLGEGRTSIHLGYIKGACPAIFK